MVLQVDVLDGDSRGFIYPRAVVIDDGKQRPVAWGIDGVKKSVELALGEVFRKLLHNSVDIVRDS